MYITDGTFTDFVIIRTKLDYFLWNSENNYIDFRFKFQLGCFDYNLVGVELFVLLFEEDF